MVEGVWSRGEKRGWTLKMSWKFGHQNQEMLRDSCPGLRSISNAEEARSGSTVSQPSCKRKRIDAESKLVLWLVGKRRGGLVVGQVVPFTRSIPGTTTVGSMTRTRKPGPAVCFLGCSLGRIPKTPMHSGPTSLFV